MNRSGGELPATFAPPTYEVAGIEDLAAVWE